MKAEPSAVRPAARLIVRRADPADLEDLAHLEQLSFSLPRSPDMLAVEMDADRSCFLVAERAADSAAGAGQAGSKIVGYLSWETVLDEVQVGNICVNPEDRGQGAGRALLREMIRLTAGGAYNKILLEVRAGNRAAIRLYEGAGFCAVGRRKNYYFKPVEDAILMDYNF